MNATARQHDATKNTTSDLTMTTKATIDQNARKLPQEKTVILRLVM